MRAGAEYSLFALTEAAAEGRWWLVVFPTSPRGILVVTYVGSSLVP